jgi:hypothetical protein
VVGRRVKLVEERKVEHPKAYNCRAAHKLGVGKKGVTKDKSMEY